MQKSIRKFIQRQKRVNIHPRLNSVIVPTGKEEGRRRLHESVF